MACPNIEGIEFHVYDGEDFYHNKAVAWFSSEIEAVAECNRLNKAHPENPNFRVFVVTTFEQLHVELKIH